MTEVSDHKLPDPELLRQFVAEVIVTNWKQRGSRPDMQDLTTADMNQLVAEAVQAATKSGLVEAGLQQETALVMQQDKPFLDKVRAVARTL